MESVPSEADSRHLAVGDNPAGLVGSLIQPTRNLESGPGLCRRDQIDYGLVRLEWFPSPVLANEGEEAMFYLVPLARTRGEMAHGDWQTCLVCQLLKFPLPKAKA